MTDAPCIMLDNTGTEWDFSSDIQAAPWALLSCPYFGLNVRTALLSLGLLTVTSNV